MMPTLKEIVWQIAILHELHPKETVSEIAGRLMLSPLYVINALDEGESMELFQRQRDKKGVVTEVLETVSPIDWKNLGSDVAGTDIQRLQGEILRAINTANADENDVEDGMLQMWCRGIKPSAVEMALRFLYQGGIIDHYELADPGDKKSVYTFHTLRPNNDKQWGSKQFKKPKKEKKS
jgi:hypothetical protein